MAFVLGATALCAQETAVFNNDPMQERALNVPESEYVLREPTGAEVVEPRVEPPNWWVGIEDTRLELMVHEKGAAKYTEATTDYPGPSAGG